MNIKTTIENLEKAASARGGGTTYLTERRGRYVVGGVVSATARLGENLTDVVSKLTEAVATTTVDTIGSWLENGLVYYDLGTVTDNEQQAHQWAVERGEIAYYDMQEQTSIYTLQ